MFKQLRNRFILTNMVITTIILVIAFSTIFTVAAIGAERPHQAPQDVEREMPSEFQEMMHREIDRERGQHLSSLAMTLIAVGIVTEMAVFGASKYYAEKSIKPVKDAYLKQREFIANASHELKTPIAAARANFEALGATEQPWANNVDSELDRADKLVKDLLILARTDGRTNVIEKKSADIARIVRRRASMIEARVGQKELRLELPEKMTQKIAATDFAQVLDILLDNAVKYSEKIVVVTLDNKTLQVSNDGNKIPQDKLEKIFERFYQADKTAEGSGLGLSIAKAVAEQNGWKLSVMSDRKMTTFKLTF